MKKHTHFIQAELEANKISKKENRTISIVRRNGEKEFIVCDKGGNDRNAHDVFVVFISNFVTRYRMKSKSNKSGEHIEYFATKEGRQKQFELNKDYRTNVSFKDLTLKEYKAECVLPCAKSNLIAENYLKELRKI